MKFQKISIRDVVGMVLSMMLKEKPVLSLTACVFTINQPWWSRKKLKKPSLRAERSNLTINNQLKLLPTSVTPFLAITDRFTFHETINPDGFVKSRLTGEIPASSGIQCFGA